MHEGAVMTQTPPLLPVQVSGSPQVEDPGEGLSRRVPPTISTDAGRSASPMAQQTPALSGKKKQLVLTEWAEGFCRGGTSVAGQGGVDGGRERRSERTCAHRGHLAVQDELSSTVVAAVGERSLCMRHVTAFVSPSLSTPLSSTWQVCPRSPNWAQRWPGPH